MKGKKILAAIIVLNFCILGEVFFRLAISIFSITIKIWDKQISVFDLKLGLLARKSSS
jgi:hypothetical protein